MVCHTWDNLIFELYPSSGILKNNNNTTFRKLDPFPASREGMGDDYSVGSVTNLSHWTGLGFALSDGPNRVGFSTPSPEGGKNSVFETLRSLTCFRIMDDEQSPKNPAISNF
jgi:hypothetical protein